MGGSYPWEGRVEIYFLRTWGTITDSDWTSDDAQVVCRKLGYFKPGATGLTGAYFGSGSGPIHLDSVVCSGTEYNLTDCQVGKGTRQSSHSEGVGVKCQTIVSSYREGYIRLVGGDYNWEGRVEIFYSGTWSTISDTSWTSSDATVVCRQLRHSTSTEGAVPRCCGYYGEGSGPINVRVVSCTGFEPNITSCSFVTTTVYNHQNDVGVQCQQGEIYNEGDIRLVGGTYSWQGRVEIYLYGEWGTITHHGATPVDAHVVCRQLGYDTRYGFADLNLNWAAFGEGSGPIHMNYLGCNGTEYKLVDCYYENSTYQHNEDWSVTCKNDFPSNGEVRLYNNYYNPSYYRGLVEVYISEVWGTVANDGSWSREDGEVVCRELGFEIPSEGIRLSTSYSSSFRETASVHMSGVQCLGTESRLVECPHSVGGSGTVATLYCYYYNSEQSCFTGQLRLVGGETEMEGRIEICTSYYRWGTVCNKQWTPSHTRVVCRNLGYSDTEGSYEASHTYGGTWIPILIDYVNCSGSEVRLWDCLHFTHSYSGCSHSDDAGVRCQPVPCDDGDVRLLTEEILGPLKVCVNKRWVTVCYEGWTDVDSSVVCRQLGYTSGTAYYISSARHYGLAVHHVSCYGTETRLSDCTYTSNDDGFCYNELRLSCNLADCVDGQVRLMEGEFEWEGRLEVCFGQRWGTISSDGWTEANSQVVCNDLGYDLDTAANYSPLRTATKSMPIFMSNVQCSDMDSSLLDCSYSRNISNRDHSKDCGVKCKKFSCDDGDLRLVGGDSQSEGRLDICFSQRWGTVNGDGWSFSDTQVACKQLGFEGVHSSYERKSILSAPIFMDNVACYGTENKLIDCNYHTDTTEDDHSNDIWINCDTTEQSSDQSTAKAALSISVVLLVFFIAVIVILIIIAVLLYKRKSGASTTESVHYQRDGNRDARITAKRVDNNTNKAGKSPYQPNTKNTSSLQRSGNENVQRSGQAKVGESDYRSRPLPATDEDEQLYEDM